MNFIFATARCGRLVLLAACLFPGLLFAQTEGDWPYYRGNLAGTGYSALDSITAENVNQLGIAWRYDLRSESDPDRSANSQVTPIVIDGVMYIAAADRIVALDPVTGSEIWRHNLLEGSPSRRGVAYREGSSGISPRIYYTSYTTLVALNAATGEPDASFGTDGQIDMGTPYISVPLVFDDVIVVGANTPRGAPGGIGNPRAFDAATGAKLWVFSSVPQPGSLGHDTWEGDSWQNRLGANAWPFYFTVDSEHDLLYLPLASPIPFAYGGDRAGDNLYANALVAVNLHTGQYVWHFQTIHHDLWDHDPPSAPTLFELERGGRSIPALAITTKSGYLFILNRVTGEPLVDVRELQVDQSNVPGEETSPTQPFPVTPPLARVSYSPNELVTASDTSLAHAAACQQRVDELGELLNAGAYTPWTYKPNANTGATTLLFPGLGGGPNWGGAPYDPATGYVFVFAGDTGTLGWMEDADADYPYQLGGPRPGGFDVRIDGMSLPCQKPPWGRLSAVDTRTGAIAWQQVLGVSEVLPEGKQLTGRPGRAGVLVTGSGLLFIGATDDSRFRALQADTGELLWEVTLPARANANPMTYLGNNGQQYIAVSATNELVSFQIPGN